MNEKFEASEKYRKYLIGLQFKDSEFFTVWGTDMVDEENDKLLVEGGKLVVFKSLNDASKCLRSIVHPFLDEDNFRRWVQEEIFNDVYNVSNLRYLDNFVSKYQKDKNVLLSVMSSLNLIEDYFIQINDDDSLELFSSEILNNFKDYIYNGYFWKRKDGSDEQNIDVGLIALILKKIYSTFSNCIDVRGV